MQQRDRFLHERGKSSGGLGHSTGVITSGESRDITDSPVMKKWTIIED